MTVHASAPECRSRNAKFLMKYKHACTPSELVNESEDYIGLHDSRNYLDIIEWDINDLKANDEYLGLSGSPTKVKAVNNIIFTTKESKLIDSGDKEIDDMMVELLEQHNIG